MGDRAGFVITLRNQEDVVVVHNLLKTEATEHHWVTPTVAVGLVKQLHPDFSETLDYFQNFLPDGSTLTIVEESGAVMWSEVEKQCHIPRSL